MNLHASLMTKDLAEDYRRAGFGGQLRFGARPALVAVDVVSAYTDRTSPLYAGVERAVSSARKLLETARECRIPIFLTKVEYSAHGKDGGVFYRKAPVLKVFDRGSPWGAFAQGFEPLPGEFVIVKQYASAFFGTTLASTLTALQVDTTVIVGLTTSGCIRATALDALQHGFVPFVVSDAVGDRDPRPHQANLFDLQAKYAEVVSQAKAVRLLKAKSVKPRPSLRGKKGAARRKRSTS